MMNLSDEEKKRIYDFLAESYIDLVSKGLIGKFERKVISKKILNGIEQAQNHDDVYGLINTLMKTYPEFSTALVRVKGEINKVHETQVIDQLKQFIHAG